ncbi:hypothetical protein B0T16DRAFT_207256 [Cercophora newfieldiana]|uniref:Uncharacterized protein n=1 Tax=Cercophora newfieldiana TaxID=92897 RepID=A0AA39XVM1_9PEZI|nr:hypothetical protein B0T16DRAFT_207256 [Cercophora newfieldiana]
MAKPRQAKSRQSAKPPARRTRSASKRTESLSESDDAAASPTPAVPVLAPTPAPAPALAPATSGSKRGPGEETKDAPRKRVRLHRLDAPVSRAKPSSDDEEDGVVNPAILDAMNNGPFTSSPQRSTRPPRAIATRKPRSKRTSRKARNLRGPVSTGAALDVIDESSREHDPDAAISSVEQDEADDQPELQDQHTESQNIRVDAYDDFPEDEDDELDNTIQELQMVVAEAPPPSKPKRTINGLSAQEGADHERPTGNRLPARRNIVPDIEDKDFGYESDLGHLGQGNQIGEARVSLSLSPPPVTQPIYTATVDTRRVRAMLKFMGRDGWTGGGEKRWEQGFAQGEPGNHLRGKRLFKYLHRFRTLIRGAPTIVGKHPRSLSKQVAWLRGKQDDIKKLVSEINKQIKKIRDEELALPRGPDDFSRAALERRQAMVMDLMNPIIPQLIRVLSSLFSLGGANSVNPRQLPEEVIITPDVLGYIQEVLTWIGSLRGKMRWELRERPLENTDRPLAKQQESAWSLFDSALRELNRNVEEAEEQHEIQEQNENEQERLLECAHRDEMIREARRREEEAEQDRKIERMRLVAHSTQYIASLPNPVSELWRKATAREEYWAASQSVSRPKPVMSGARRPPIPQPLEQPTPWKDADKEWLLLQIRPEGRKPIVPTKADYEDWAEALGVTRGELLNEVRSFQITFHNKAQEKGLKMEEWARKDIMTEKWVTEDWLRRI